MLAEVVSYLATIPPHARYKVVQGFEQLGLISSTVWALDGAIRSGHNPQGLDPRPEIPRCRELVASPHLVFSERYVAELDAMAQRWETRPPAR